MMKIQLGTRRPPGVIIPLADVIIMLDTLSRPYRPD